MLLLSPRLITTSLLLIINLRLTSPSKYDRKYQSTGGLPDLKLPDNLYKILAFYRAHCDMYGLDLKELTGTLKNITSNPGTEEQKEEILDAPEGTSIIIDEVVDVSSRRKIDRSGDRPMGMENSILTYELTNIGKNKSGTPINELGVDYFTDKIQQESLQPLNLFAQPLPKNTEKKSQNSKFFYAPNRSPHKNNRAKRHADPRPDPFPKPIAHEGMATDSQKIKACNSQCENYKKYSEWYDIAPPHPLYTKSEDSGEDSKNQNTRNKNQKKQIMKQYLKPPLQDRLISVYKSFNVPYYRENELIKLSIDNEIIREMTYKAAEELHFRCRRDYLKLVNEFCNSDTDSDYCSAAVKPSILRLVYFYLLAAYFALIRW